MINSIKKGVKVKTAGGIIGEVDEVTDTEAVVVVDKRNNVSLTFSKTSIVEMM